ncbi:isoleucine--tRNA ligase [Candidatus Aenigmatarchaeota archaeon]
MYTVKDVEKKVKDFWKKEKVPEKIVSFDKDTSKKYYLLDGPPYVNGVPHVGHAKTTVFKDIWGKFKKMQGFDVWFQPGFDCGGLPIENKVEAELKIKSKTDIEKIGVDKFIHACQDFAKGNEDIWLNFYKKIAAWRGWLTPYLTSENYYVESGWWTVKQWFEKGLLVEGQRPGHWCPRCETVLAGIEASESYKNLEDPSITIKAEIAKNEYLLVWTTTPWTLPGNVAIIVHPDETYVKIKVDHEIFILAEARLEILEKIEKGYTVLEKFPGKKLAGIKYKPFLDVPTQQALEKNDAALRVYVSVPVMKKRVASKTLAKGEAEGKDEFGHVVTMDTGTGLVHTAPGHGDIDNKIGKHYKLPELSPVDEKGKLMKSAGKFAGLFVKKADKEIIAHLKKTGVLLHSERITHSYPLCWRCKTPLIYRMSRQWFLTLDSLREKIINANKKDIKWLPEFARERYNNLVIEAPDWPVTRQRYWGIPLPIWTCKKCKTKRVFGSSEELTKESGKKLKDLHKHTVDKIKLKCECGSEMIRERDIMDVWFDSGISPWASLGYPFKNKKLFEKLWKVDLIDESQDQVRAWFHALILCGFATFDEQSFKTVCLNGWTLDEKGEKMSKSVGNVVYASDAYDELGADLLRLYICNDTTPWDTQKFSMRNAKDLGRTLNILFNTYNYFKTYSRIDPSKYNLPIEDRWILSCLNSLVKLTTESIEQFKFHEASRGIVKFITDDFSRTYVKLIRPRDDRAVDYTLTKIFETLPKIMAPYTPFISEYIFSELFETSVHLEKWPSVTEGDIDVSLEEEVEKANEIISAINSMRKESQIKLRWPMKEVVINKKMKNKVEEIISNLANVKKVVFDDNAEGLDENERYIKKDIEGMKIYLDITVIEDEALLRELIRDVQSKRKEKGLVVTDKIKLSMDSEELKKFEDLIKEKVGAVELVYKDIEEKTGKALYKEKQIKYFFKKV